MLKIAVGKEKWVNIPFFRSLANTSFYCLITIIVEILYIFYGFIVSYYNSTLQNCFIITCISQIITIIIVFIGYIYRKQGKLNEKFLLIIEMTEFIILLTNMIVSMSIIPIEFYSWVHIHIITMHTLGFTEIKENYIFFVYAMVIFFGSIILSFKRVGLTIILVIIMFEGLLVHTIHFLKRIGDNLVLRASMATELCARLKVNNISLLKDRLQPITIEMMQRFVFAKLLGLKPNDFMKFRSDLQKMSSFAKIPHVPSYLFDNQRLLTNFLFPTQAIDSFPSVPSHCISELVYDNHQLNCKISNCCLVEVSVLDSLTELIEGTANHIEVFEDIHESIKRIARLNSSLILSSSLSSSIILVPLVAEDCLQIDFTNIEQLLCGLWKFPDQFKTTCCATFNLHLSVAITEGEFFLSFIPFRGCAISIFGESFNMLNGLSYVIRKEYSQQLSENVNNSKVSSFCTIISCSKLKEHLVKSGNLNAMYHFCQANFLKEHLKEAYYIILHSKKSMVNNGRNLSLNQNRDHLSMVELEFEDFATINRLLCHFQQYLKKKLNPKKINLFLFQTHQVFVPMVVYYFVLLIFLAIYHDYFEFFDFVLCLILLIINTTVGFGLWIIKHNESLNQYMSVNYKHNIGFTNGNNRMNLTFVGAESSVENDSLSPSNNNSNKIESDKNYTIKRYFDYIFFEKENLKKDLSFDRGVTNIAQIIIVIGHLIMVDVVCTSIFKYGSNYSYITILVCLSLIFPTISIIFFVDLNYSILWGNLIFLCIIVCLMTICFLKTSVYCQMFVLIFNFCIFFVIQRKVSSIYDLLSWISITENCLLDDYDIRTNIHTFVDSVFLNNTNTSNQCTFVSDRTKNQNYGSKINKRTLKVENNTIILIAVTFQTDKNLNTFSNFVPFSNFLSQMLLAINNLTQEISSNFKGSLSWKCLGLHRQSILIAAKVPKPVEDIILTQCSSFVSLLVHINALNSLMGKLIFPVNCKIIVDVKNIPETIVLMPQTKAPLRQMFKITNWQLMWDKDLSVAMNNNNEMYNSRNCHYICENLARIMRNSSFINFDPNSSIVICDIKFYSFTPLKTAVTNVELIQKILIMSSKPPLTELLQSASLEYAFFANIFENIEDDNNLS
eukprot:TRINITY_DN2342_c0_g1_i1.p1 TRINITY_DN2342_c0_g1~~TRINITY_DN2342_c0_g1_i1.p1  ORF type:complete len:1122 (+),score=186.49 TRINITY_DN2342_c0_g1_i1:73-3438(+)